MKQIWRKNLKFKSLQKHILLLPNTFKKTFSLNKLNVLICKKVLGKNNNSPFQLSNESLTKVWYQIPISISNINTEQFIFNGIHYLQKFGCAMGTICTPNYANGKIMGKFERNYSIHILKHFQIFIVDLSMISFYSVMKAKHNY